MTYGDVLNKKTLTGKITLIKQSKIGHVHICYERTLLPLLFNVYRGSKTISDNNNNNNTLLLFLFKRLTIRHTMHYRVSIQTNEIHKKTKEKITN